MQLNERINMLDEGTNTMLIKVVYNIIFARREHFYSPLRINECDVCGILIPLTLEKLPHFEHSAEANTYFFCDGCYATEILPTKKRLYRKGPGGGPPKIEAIMKDVLQRQTITFIFNDNKAQ